MLVLVEQQADGLERERRADIEGKPSRQVPAADRLSRKITSTETVHRSVFIVHQEPPIPGCYFPVIVDDDAGLAVDVRDEESEHDVDGEEAVDDVVHDERRPGQVPQERELQRAYPRRVHHQEDQKRLPDPAWARARTDILRRFLI